MSKKEVINLEINEEKFEEINRLIEEEANKRAGEKIRTTAKKVVAGLVLVGSITGVSLGTFKAFDYAIEKEAEINAAKNSEYIEQWEAGQGKRWGEFVSDDSDDFEVKGDGYTGTYKSR